MDYYTAGVLLDTYHIASVGSLAQNFVGTSSLHQVGGYLGTAVVREIAE